MDKSSCAKKRHVLHIFMKSTVKRNKRTCEVKDYHLLACHRWAVPFKSRQEDSWGQDVHVFEPGGGGEQGWTGLWNMDRSRDPDYRAQSGGKRVQEEERTSHILAFIDGFKTIMLLLSNSTENCMSHSWVFVNVTEGRKLPKGRETRILTAAKDNTPGSGNLAVHDQHQNVTPKVLSADQTGRKAGKADQEKENRLYERKKQVRELSAKLAKVSESRRNKDNSENLQPE
ncbi:hypothetical protein TURU_037731 [Turdus rufiventris]|nr:hypothetical protein TURU_037731 [Turdus rufiventris]